MSQMFQSYMLDLGAEEDRLHEVAPTSTIATNDSQNYPIIRKKDGGQWRWQNSQIPTVHLIHDIT